MAFGLAAFVLMPPGPTQTANWSRGKKGWFSEREEIIMVNRIIREDPSKSSMHNRQPITPKLLWQSMSDYDLWPLYLIGLNFQTPMTPPSQYLTLSLKGLGFGTFTTNLLVIPSVVGSIITMVTFTYLAEAVGNLAIFGLLAQLWALPFLVYLYVVDINSINRWTAFAIMTVLLAYPSTHAIQVGWNSRNSNSVRSRTVSAALYNMACQTSGIIASNIYRAGNLFSSIPIIPRYMYCSYIRVQAGAKAKSSALSDDSPRYRRGNRVLVSLCVVNIFTTTDKGNKRLDFRFAH
ncbi:hypothetical protein VTN77DRAFT_8033 [Rasamsonia byssochlamydoides]|uniref:uncharacterized protein n=1 Tax=Rasamsonia byssochlamydoides TaxID=89139 RepID=UPI003742241F